MKTLLACCTLATLLTACASGRAAPAAKPTSSKPPAVTIAPTGDVNQAYLDAVRGLMPGASDASIINLAHAVCTGFANGQTMADEMRVFTSDGTIPATQATIVISLSADAYCPQYAPKAAS